jgi:small-conductance mechanosensitive channel
MDTLFTYFSITDLWLEILLSIALSLFIGLFIQWLLFKLLELGNKRKPTVLKAQILQHLNMPFKFLLPLLFVYGSLSSFELSAFWKKLIEACIIINFTWVLIAFLQGLEVLVKQKFQVEGNYKVKERKVLTQLRFLKSLAFIVIITLAIASIFWNITEVRKIGTTILTSAGVIGIIVGVAAQKSIANLITGFQIAFTQPIKINDKVEIEGEFGTIEDITLTYVVVKTWDLRRLVLPLNYFNDNPLINYSFNSPELIGTVLLYVDYSFPINALRSELMSLLKSNPLWSKKAADLLVTKADQLTIEIRASFSAKNASDVWDLRCTIREQLLEFMQQHHSASLPKLRHMQVFQI